MKKHAFIYIILAGVLWGTSGLFAHYLSPLGFSSVQMTGVRGIISAVALVVYALIKNKGFFRITLSELFIFAGIGVMLFLAAIFYYSAMQLTSVSTAVVVMYTAPIIVSVFSAIFFGEKFTPIKTAAVGLMLAGCALVAGIVGGISLNPMGLLLAFGSSVTYAGYNLLTKWAMRRGSRPESSSIYSFCFMALISLFVSEPIEVIKTAAEKPWPSIPLLLGLGICTFVVPYFLYTLSLKTLPAGTASALSIVEPLSATVFSILLLGEKLTLPSGIGMALIIGAVFILGVTDRDGEEGLSEQRGGDIS